MKVLVVDSNMDRDCWGAKDIVRHLSEIEGLQIHVRRGPQRDLPRDLTPFDRIILSGSREAAATQADWITDIEDLTRRSLDQNRPLLGVCFGHQIMARALGGEVRRNSAPEVGWTQIETLSRVPLFEGLPNRFFSFSNHYDIVSKVPPGSQVFAKSDDCQIQGFRILGKPLYGVQFHPETENEGAERTYRELKSKGEESHFQNWKRRAQLKIPGSKIFENFILGENP
jgi:GMP synthase-like glutamine amidotransferase